MQRHLFRLVNEMQQADIWPLALRRAMLRMIGIKFEQGAMLLAHVDIVHGPLTLGAGAFINRGCHLDAAGGITIGALVHLGPGVRLLTQTHDLGPATRRAGPTRAAPIIIEDGAWLGAGVIVLPGVTIGRGAVIAAGSVVTADAKPDSLYAGVPAVRKHAL